MIGVLLHIDGDDAEVELLDESLRSTVAELLLDSAEDFRDVRVSTKRGTHTFLAPLSVVQAAGLTDKPKRARSRKAVTDDAD